MIRVLILMSVFIVFGFQSQTMAGDAAAGKAKSQVCVGCHGVNGVSIVPTYPNLAGKKNCIWSRQSMILKAGYAR